MAEGVLDLSQLNKKGIMLVKEGQEHSILTLTTAAGANNQPPRAFTLTKLAGASHNAVLAYEPGRKGSSALGHITASYSAEPILTEDKVDASYVALHKERSIKAATKTRTVKPYQDTRENNVTRLTQNKAANLDAKRKAEEVRKARNDSKRMKADVDVLESVLFGLFERKTYWTLPELLAETCQVATHLKSVLNKIAVLERFGTHRNQYHLKKDYA